MRCPECDKPDAYMGLLWIHCKNRECRYFDPRYAGEKPKMTESERLILLRGIVDSMKKPTNP